MAVNCFFAVSGFLITQSWLQAPRFGDFFRKRVLRIYPGWVAALLFRVLVVAPVLRPGHGLQLGNPATFGFLSQLVLHAPGQLKLLPGIDGPVNGSTWTIPFELMCYAIVAALGVLGLFRKPFLVLAFMLVLLLGTTLGSAQALRQVLHPATVIPHVPYYRLAFLSYFLCGSLFFLFRDRVPHSPWLFAASVALVVLTLGHLPLAGLLFVLLPTAGFHALFYLAFLPLGPLHAWARHGDLSYGVYLFAHPLQKLLIAGQFRGYHLSPMTLFLAAWVLACLAAVLRWRLVERPFLRLKPRSSQPPMEQTGVPAVAAEGA